MLHFAETDNMWFCIVRPTVQGSRFVLFWTQPWGPWVNIPYNWLQNNNTTLQWRHNGHDGVSNQQPHHCLLNRLFGRRSKKTSNLRVTGLWWGIHRGPVNSPHKGPVTWKMFPFDDVIMKNTAACIFYWTYYAHRYSLQKKTGEFNARNNQSLRRRYI